MSTVTIIQKEKPRRRIPLQQNWFDYHLDAIVYSFMVASATARIKPGDKKDGSQSYIYLSQSKYTKIRPIIRKIGNLSARQVKDKVNHLIEEGYVVYDEKAKQYSFPFNKDNKYFIVSTDVIAYLCTVSNPFVIKIYFYLADKFRWKSDYKFTYKELRVMLGYSPAQNQRVTNLIKVALSALSLLKFIEYKETKVKLEGKQYKIDNFQLVNVVGKELPKAVINQLQNKLSIEEKNITRLLLG